MIDLWVQINFYSRMVVIKWNLWLCYKVLVAQCTAHSHELANVFEQLLWTHVVHAFNVTQQQRWNGIYRAVFYRTVINNNPPMLTIHSYLRGSQFNPLKLT